jgi:hypothetical protein
MGKSVKKRLRAFLGRFGAFWRACIYTRVYGQKTVLFRPFCPLFFLLAICTKKQEKSGGFCAKGKNEEKSKKNCKNYLKK